MDRQTDRQTVRCRNCSMEIRSGVQTERFADRQRDRQMNRYVEVLTHG